MSDLIVYQKPTCTTSRKALKMLDEMGLTYKKINYYQTVFTKTKLKTLLKKMNLKAEDIIRKRAKEYKELDIKNKKYTQVQLIDFMIKYPDLIERPIVEKGNVAVLGRPVERIKEIL